MGAHWHGQLPSPAWASGRALNDKMSQEHLPDAQTKHRPEQLFKWSGDRGRGGRAGLGVPRTRSARLDAGDGQKLVLSAAGTRVGWAGAWPASASRDVTRRKK